VREQLIARIAATINARTLYSTDHPRVIQSAALVVSLLEQVLSESQRDEITFLVVDEDLVIDDRVLRQGTVVERQFVETLTRRGIERLTLAAGVEAEEILNLANDLASGLRPRSSAHVVVGHVHVPAEEKEEEDQERADEREEGELIEQLELTRESFARFRTSRSLPMAGVETLVRSLLASLTRSARTTVPLAPLKEHDEYTFVHSVNVSLLVMAQARSFRLEEKLVHDFGVAALLHDIGKLTVPHAILNCPGKLENDDWEVMKGHVEQGALLLTAEKKAPPLAVIVAYEHHLRHDGQPNYPILPRPRLPNLVSRMTAIADSYDAMSTTRPYQQPLMRSAALEILRKRSGTFYDPMLVANFIRMIESSGRRG
jgi:putative nucleotidyltransferase with HDIG domain